MKITKHIAKDSILLLEDAKSKDELLSTMCSAIKPLIDDEVLHSDILEKILQRESVSSTGIGNGFACPHARIEGLELPVIVIAALKTPIDFAAHDNKKVNFVCLVAAPEKNPTIALQIMSQICKSYIDSPEDSPLKKPHSAYEIYKYLRKANLSTDVPVTAAEIMQPAPFTVTAKMPLRQVTAKMAKHRLNAVAVADDEGKMIGHITCSILFNFGLPDFFSKLKSVSFISEFDPFEKYFYEEAHSFAEDLASKDFMAVEKSATLLEIVFALTTLGHPMIYVLEDECVCGIIDQETVLEQIVNL